MVASQSSSQSVRESMPLLTATLKLGREASNRDEKLQLLSLDPGWTPEKRMRSGLQKQHRLRRGRACQATSPWCFSITSPGSVSHLLKAYQGVSLTVDPKEGHALHTILMKNTPVPDNWIMPLDLQASHRSCLVSQLYPTTSCCLETGVFSPLCAFPET